MLSVVQEWNAARSTIEFESIAISALARLVRCDAIGWDRIDVAGRTVRATTDPPDYVSGPLLAELGRLIGQNPIVTYYATHRAGAPVAISDFLDARTYERLELYDDVYRPLHVADQLGCAVQTGDLLTGVAFNRSRRSFTDRDRAVLDVVRPHLARAYENARAWEILQERVDLLERGLEGRGRSVAQLRDGRIVPLSREADRLVRSWSLDPAHLGDGRPLVMEHDGARLVVRTATGDTSLLLLDETRTAPDPARVRELGLTAREAEILALAARGLSDAEVAGRLVVSVRTVEKHLENVYRKLDVTDRRQAVAKALGKENAWAATSAAAPLAAHLYRLRRRLREHRTAVVDRDAHRARLSARVHGDRASRERGEVEGVIGGRDGDRDDVAVRARARERGPVVRRREGPGVLCLPADQDTEDVGRAADRARDRHVDPLR
ncbi:MAG: helix-turn-helix transcriptional regulator [Chloroflexota bacterium]|nr:helix-turn-helix transcriptional regulator [Chloroflexota bacterium]